MTTAMTTDLELMRTRLSGAIGHHLPGHIERLGWDAGQLAAHQRDRLRALLARAMTRSPFHAARLRGVDPDRFELADLARLPVMTKADMMENFDAATTDRQLTRDLVERHLARSVTDPSLLLGDYVVLVSGGSSGQRGLFVQAADEYAEFAASVTRRAMAATVAAAGGMPPEGLVIGMVGAGSPVHSSGLACVTATRPPVRLVSAPASLPVAEIVRRLNAAQPPNLLAYAAKLAELAREQRDGRLRLNLRSVTSMSEAISMPERIAVTEAFGVPVTDLFVSTEGLVGHSEPGEAVLTFAGDTCIAECVDDEGRPVPDGTTSSKVLVTNLHNLTQPIIRYELTDRFTPAGTSGGALRASVEGRSDDLFRYARASVHPFVIGAPLLHAPAVREFQVRQTERGADITAVIDGDFDSAALTAEVARSLRQAGVASPQVRFRRVGALDRDPMTSKARRFIPLSAQGSLLRPEPAAPLPPAARPAAERPARSQVQPQPPTRS
jgi:phenylacetate-coenzyme A ligase PaaK-like adenylate-forming protein